MRDVVNAAGAWSRAIAAMAGIDIPVRATAQHFQCVVAGEAGTCSAADRSDAVSTFVRKGATYICGTSPSADNDPDDLPLDEVDHALFDDVIWPTLAHRVPAFEALRVENCWSGYYEYNVLDQNAIIGYPPGRRELHLRERLQRARSAAGTRRRGAASAN